MKTRTAICIPTYNNRETIAGVVADCLEQTDLPILVVDDGSDEAVEHIVPSHQRVSHLRFSENRGKGAALQSGFTHFRNLGFTHVVTIDGDGQHPAKAIETLLQSSKEHPWDLVIGKRKLVQETVPGITKFGRKFSNFWVKYNTSLPVQDSQSGLRIYPLFCLQGMTFFTKRFDFEIEVLTRLFWRGVKVQEPEVETTYFPPEKRVTHFNKLTDNVRITLLNIAFIVLSLFQSHLSPLKGSLALATGVFIGCTPFFGLHSFIAAAAAFFLRLNFPMIWLGSQVSIPPLAPLLAIASIKVGSQVTGKPVDLVPSDFTFEIARSMFETWLIGSLALGLGLGLLTFLIAWFIGKQVKKPTRPWSGKSRGGVLGFLAMRFVLKVLGLRGAYFSLNFVVPYFFLFAPRATLASYQYWKIREPGSGFFRRTSRVLHHFKEFGRVLVDKLAQQHSPEPLFQSKPHGFENILQPLKDKKGLIMMSAHVGSWDMAGRFMELDGYEDTLHVAKHLPQKGSFEHHSKSETDRWENAQVIGNDLGIFEMKEHLQAGRPLAFLIDRPFSKNVELVPLFGHLYPIDTTPFRIAASTGVSCLSTFGFKSDQNERSYDFYARPAVEIVKQSDPLEWILPFRDHLEELMDRYPAQWFNFYKTFSTIPKNY